MAKISAKLGQIVDTRFKKLQLLQQPIFDEVEIYRQMYSSQMTEDPDYPWDYQYIDPHVFPMMRANLARISPGDIRIQLDPRGPEDVSKRKVNQQFLNWEMDEMLRTQFFYRLLFGGFMAGRSYFKTGWKYEKAVEIQGKNKTYKLTGVTNRADAKYVRFNDMFIPNRNIPEISEQPYLIEHIYMPYGDMLDDNEIQGKNVWDPQKLEKIQKQRLFATKVDYGLDLPKDDELQESMIVRAQYVEMLRMQTMDGDVIYTLMSGGDKDVLNTDSESPYDHDHYCYGDFAPFPEDDNFFSMGIVQPVADLQMALSSVLNQYLTQSRKAGNPMWIAGAQASQTPDWQFVNRPDGIVRVAGDVNQVKQVVPVDNKDSMITLRTELNTAFERATSMSSLYSSGVSGGSSPSVNKTATGARVIDSNIDLNLQLVMQILGAMTITTIGRHFLELNAQYVTEDQVFKVTGKEGQADFINMPATDVSANFDIIVNPDQMMKTSPAMRQASLLNFKAQLDADKEVKKNTKPIWRAIMASYQELDSIDVNEVIIDPVNKFDEDAHIIMNGYPAEVKFDDDHQALITLAQAHLMDMQHDDKTTLLFMQYISEHKKYMEAANPNLLIQQPAPQSLPMVDEAALSQAMAAKNLPPQPTNAGPVTIPQAAMG